MKSTILEFYFKNLAKYVIYFMLTLHCKHHQLKFKLKPNPTRFKFGDGAFLWFRSIQIRTLTPNASFLKIEMDIVEAYVSVLHSSYIIDREGLVPINWLNGLQAPYHGCSLLTVRKHEQLYPVWSSTHILCTGPELWKLHRHFRHPSTDKPWALIRRASLKQAGSATRRTLEEISRSFETCQIFTIPRQRFRVSFPPGEAMFNREMSLDFMRIDKNSVHHVLDLETNIEAVTFLKHRKVEGVWYSFISCWAELYTVFLKKRRMDQGVYLHPLGGLIAMTLLEQNCKHQVLKHITHLEMESDTTHLFAVYTTKLNTRARNESQNRHFNSQWKLWTTPWDLID